jgi:hypothetical protein
VTQGWKVVLPDLQYNPPSCIEDLLSCNVWSCPEVALIGPGFSRRCAANLHKAGLRKYRDIMRGAGFITADEVQERFGLKQEESGAWEAAVRTMTRRWRVILTSPPGRTYEGEWVGIYHRQNSTSPLMVAQTNEAFTPKIGTGTY